MPKSISRRNLLKIGAVAGLALFTGIKADLRPSVGHGTANATVKVDGQIGFLFDEGLCINCKLCENACKNNYKWEKGVFWRKVYERKAAEGQRRILLSMACNHCSEPACMSVCPTTAYTQRTNDGIVKHYPSRCVGCKYCMLACPYQVPKFSDESGTVSKCHFCFERQDQGHKPFCVSACPTGALSMGKISEIGKRTGAVARIANLPDPNITKSNLRIIPKS